MGEKSVFDALKWLLYSNLKASVTSFCQENSPSFTCSLCPSKIISLRVDLFAKKKTPLLEKNYLAFLCGSLPLYGISYFLFLSDARGWPLLKNPPFLSVSSFLIWQPHSNISFPFRRCT